MLDQLSFYKEKIVCTYDDVIQIPDYIVCQYIKKYKDYFDFYIDINKLNKYNDDTLIRLVLARTDKDIFKCLRKPSVNHNPEFRKGIYKVFKDLYDKAPVLTTVDMINKIGQTTDFVYSFSIILSDSRQRDHINKFINPGINFSAFDNFDPAIHNIIQDATIIITDDIDLIFESFKKDPLKRYLVPITGYTAKRVDDTYILCNNIMSKLDNFDLVSAITFYQPFNFERKHLI